MSMALQQQHQQHIVAAPVPITSSSSHSPTKTLSSSSYSLSSQRHSNLCKNYKITLVDYLSPHSTMTSTSSSTSTGSPLIDIIKQNLGYKTFDPLSNFDNIKTTHEYVDGHMTSLHLWSRCIRPGVDAEESFSDLSRRVDLRQLYRNSRCIVICFRSSNLVWQIRRHLERLMLTSPSSMIVLVQIGIPASQTPQILTEINSFYDNNVHTMVLEELSNMEQIEFFLKQLTRLCFDDFFNKFSRKHYQFLIRDWFPFWISRIQQMYNGDELDLLLQAMSSLEAENPDTQLLQLEHQARRLRPGSLHVR